MTEEQRALIALVALAAFRAVEAGDYEPAHEQPQPEPVAEEAA